MADYEELSRQAKEHLQSLREAGLDWLPKGEPPTVDESGEEPSASLVNSGSALFASESDGMSLDDRRIALETLAEEVAGCSRCSQLYSTRTQTVFADGPAGAELCIIGEAPGYDEDKQGLPFVGAAGQLLNKMIAACGFQREEVYICNILKCRPPGNRNPLADEAENCREYLDRQLELVAPKFICAMGAIAAQNLLGTTQGIGRMRRRFHDYEGIPVLCTYHPAYLLRSPERKRDAWDDLKMLLREMGRPIPDAKKS